MCSLIVCVVCLIGAYIVFKNIKYLRQRLFTSLMSFYIWIGVTKCLEPRRGKLFSQLQQIVSKDSELKSKGKGCIRLLEIGIGSGSNLKYYPNNTHLISLDPNPHFDPDFEKNKKNYPNIVYEKFVYGFAEDMSMVSDNSIDVVVSTHVLCSVSDINACLREIKRVLVPNGKFIYMEHTSYKSGTFYRKIQACLQWIWKVIHYNCRLINNTSEAISKAGFTSIQQEYIVEDQIPNIVIRPHIFGTATK